MCDFSRQLFLKKMACSILSKKTRFGKKAHYPLLRARVRARGLLPALEKQATQEECRFRESYLSLAVFCFYRITDAKVYKNNEKGDDFPVLSPLVL